MIPGALRCGAPAFVCLRLDNKRRQKQQRRYWGEPLLAKGPTHGQVKASGWVQWRMTQHVHAGVHKIIVVKGVCRLMVGPFPLPSFPALVSSRPMDGLIVHGLRICPYRRADGDVRRPGAGEGRT